MASLGLPQRARIVQAAAVVLVSAASPALAQARGALDQLDPPPAGEAFSAVPSSGDPGWLRASFATTLELAYRPIVDPSGEASSSAVDHQLVLHGLASLGFLNRLLVDVDLPLVLHQDGSLSAASGPSVRPSPTAASDPRFGAKVVLLQAKGAAPGLSLGANVWVPVSQDDELAGASTARLGVAAHVGGSGPRYVWGGFLGGRLVPSPTDLVGSVVRTGFAFAWRSGQFQIGPEWIGSVRTDASAVGLAERVGFELLADAKLQVGPFAASIFGGPCFGGAPGTPTFRLGSTLSVTVDRPAPVHRALPAAPVAEVPPPPDPDRPPRAVTGPVSPPPGVTSPTSTPTSTLAATDGMSPPDGGAVDPPLPTVRLDATQIVITEQVRFKPGSAEIDPSSDALLSSIAALLVAHPEIARIGVDGHTDDRGAPADNLALSRRRAVAVVQWLNAHGVDARRTEARGFGSRQPIADSSTEAGRAKNRRVEFIVLRRATGAE